MPLRPSFILAGRLWRLYANAAGFVLLALSVGYFIVRVVSVDGAVITARDVRALVTKTTVGGTFIYSYDQDRHEGCPGEVVQTYSQGYGKDAVVVQVVRPILLTDPRYYDDIRVVVNVPPTISPGKWTFNSGISSRCPTRQRYDPIANFEIEIVPP